MDVRVKLLSKYKSRISLGIVAIELHENIKLEDTIIDFDTPGWETT